MRSNASMSLNQAVKTGVVQPPVPDHPALLWARLERPIGGVAAWPRCT